MQFRLRIPALAAVFPGPRPCSSLPGELKSTGKRNERLRSGVCRRRSYHLGRFRSPKRHSVPSALALLPGAIMNPHSKNWSSLAPLSDVRITCIGIEDRILKRGQTVQSRSVGAIGHVTADVLCLNLDAPDAVSWSPGLFGSISDLVSGALLKRLQRYVALVELVVVRSFHARSSRHRQIGFVT